MLCPVAWEVKLSIFIKPNWPVPDNVCAATTTCANLNLAHYVDDQSEQVMINRRRLREQLNLPNEPIWLNQQHSIEVINLGRENHNLSVDGSYTNKANIVCAVLTADCLPILLCSSDGKEIAVLHAGWRGLLNGIIAKGRRHFRCESREIFAWLGPAISQQAFEVGSEVREAFIQHNVRAAEAFHPSKNADHWMMDIYQLARQQLNQLGVNKIYGGDFCTYSNQERFYSYRRDGQTSRMASLIWRG